LQSGNARANTDCDKRWHSGLSYTPAHVLLRLRVSTTEEALALGCRAEQFELYSNFNNIIVRGFILNGAPFAYSEHRAASV
jgi:hypothetical protein